MDCNTTRIEFGITRAEFHENYFERTPYLRRACFDATSFGWHVIDQALTLQDPAREMLKILKNGRVEPSNYVEDFVDIGIRRKRILKDRLYHLISTGATLVLNRVELVSPALHNLCMQVGRLVGAKTTGNVYASLCGDAATNVHWDTHDVFVIQLAGRKSWRIYEPTMPLPISSQTSNERKQDVPAHPFLEIVIEAGDVLYIPRGWWHRVAPVDTETIHLTVGIHTPLILDYIIWACSNVLPDYLEMRHSMIGRFDDERRLLSALKVATSSLLNPDMIAAFQDRIRIKERAITPFSIGPLVTESAFLLSPGDGLRLNSYSANEDSDIFYVNGQRLTLDEGCKQIVRELAAGPPSIDVGILRTRLCDFDELRLDVALKALALADIIEIIPVTKSGSHHFRSCLDFEKAPKRKTLPGI